MMKLFKLFIVTCSMLSLISCANRESLPRTIIVNTDTITLNNGTTVDILTENAINGDVVDDTNNYLNIVSRADTAKVVGLKVLEFATLFLDGTGSGSIDGFSKEDLKGSYINSVPNKTMDYLTPQLYTIIKKFDANNQKDNVITIQPYKFKLIYDGLTDNKYNFIYNTTIRTNGFHFDCSEQNDLTPEERTKPFNEWEINNYQLVQDTASKAINACINRLKSEQNITNFENALK
ncbi:hypothetical protein A9G09_02435 [Gilliamella sp. wkB292]|nr:hypothetical protein A9G09_02435 [Gilliamella apicola]OCL23404.1 hypothetical protein A9G03_00140 [Gilliamella apicola]